SPLEALRPATSEVQGRAFGRGAVLGAVLVVVAAVGLVSGIYPLAGLGGVCFLVGLILVAPVLVQPIARLFSALLSRTIAGNGVGELAEANLNRQSTRAAITASTIMISLAIIVATGGLVNS